MMSCIISSACEAHNFLRSQAFKAAALGQQLLWNEVNAGVTPKETFGWLKKKVQLRLNREFHSDVLQEN